MHLTLKFLGDVSDGQLPNVCEAVKSAAAQSQPFEFSVTGVGCFPKGGAVRVLWVGVEDASGELAKCQAAIESAVEPLGFPRESREFSPHLTLGRVKDAPASSRIRDALRNAAITPMVQAVDSVVLYESQLSPGGARYTPVCREALIG